MQGIPQLPMLVFSLFKCHFCYFTRSYCELSLLPIPLSVDMNVWLLTFTVTKWTIGILSPLNSHMMSLLFFFFFFLFIKQIPYFCLFLGVRFSQPPSILVAFFVLFPVGLYLVLWFLCGTWKWIQYSSWDFTNTGLSKIIVMGVLRKAALLNISVIYYLYCVDSNSVCDPL